MTGPKGPYKQILPGLYEDRDGSAVLNVADILRELGWEDTPENRLEVFGALRQLIQETAPQAEIRLRLPGDPKWRGLG